MGGRLAIGNVKIVTGKTIFPNGAVTIENGRIDRVYENADELPGDVEYMDGKGNLLIPGMIDVHIHGANGFDMMDGTADSIREVSMACARSGCTSFLATSVTSSLDDLLDMIRNVTQVKDTEPGAIIAGIHPEGP